MADINMRTLLDAMHYIAEARGAHDVALAEYDGCSWGYHGSSLIVAMDRSEKAFEVALEQYIEIRVQAELAKRSQGDNQ